MARLAQNWVESNFSSTITPIVTLEKSFSNGFNFLKILEKKRILTEEEMQQVQDGNTPAIVLKNMKILSKGLKSINIHLSKQQIADIISEQPGGAADLIMSLKKNFENLSTGPKWRNDSYKNSIKSLNPKTVRKLEGEDEHETQFFSTLVGKAGKFREVDSYAQQKQYYDFDYDEEQRYKERLEKDHQSHLNRLAEKRQQFLETLDRRIQHRLEVTSVGKKNWKANELEKKKRLTRHLQYELTVAAQIKDKIDRENTIHASEQFMGIEDYENNLKRNGLGGDDGGNGEVLLPTTENSESYLLRIEEKVQTQWPTNTEISDFMQNLEKRTRELRLARQEKARRKRRLQVEQKAALLEIGGSSAPPSRSNSIDMSALTGYENPEEKAARKKRENEELTEKAKIQRRLQAEEGEKRVRIFAERQRMIAYENNDWNKKKEAVLAAQTARAEEKRARNCAMCQALVVELVTDLFPLDASLPASTSNMAQESVDDRLDDIYHSRLIREMKEIYQQGFSSDIVIFPKVSSSNVSDLYPSVALLTSNLAKWKVEGSPQGGPVTYNRVQSFRESALAVFEEFQQYSESKAILPFSLNFSSEYIPLLNSYTTQFLDAKAVPSQSVYLLAGGCHDISQEILTAICTWVGGSDMLSLVTVPIAVDIASKLRQMVAAADGTADPALVRFEHLYDAWNLTAITDKTLFPELSFHASRVVSDVFDIIARISSGIPLLTSSDSHTLELSGFKFSDTTLAILLAQILWLREYLCTAIYSINGSTPLTPIVLTSFNFGCPDRAVVLKVFDWFLRGGSRNNLPDGDEELANEINDEIATVPLEKGKKAAKPPAKSKKDKRDTTEVIAQTSCIRGVVWLQPSEAPAMQEIPPPTSESVSEVSQLYGFLLKKKVLGQSIASEVTERLKSSVEEFFRGIHIPLIWLGCIAHPFSVVETLIALLISSIPSIHPAAQTTELLNQTQQAQPTPPETLVGNVEACRDQIRSTLATPQRIWLNHISKTNPIQFEAFGEALNNIREGMALEVDGLGGMILSLLLRTQQVRSEMLCEKAIMCGNLKISEGKWKDLCLEWRELLIDAEKISKKTVTAQSPTDLGAFLQTKSRELECDLGDLIDLRHQRWTRQIEELADRLRTHLRALCETLRDVVKGLVMNFSPIMRRGLVDSLKLTVLLEQANYQQFPWPLKADTTRDGVARMENSRVKDEIRHQFGRLFSGLTEIQPDMVDYDGVSSLASDLLAQLDKLSVASDDSPPQEGTPTPLQVAVLNEIKMESYDMLSALLRALFDALNSLIVVKNTILTDVKDYSLQRNQYEHRLLREWVTELRQSFRSSTPYASAIEFMSSYYYGVSDDPEHDGVPRSSLSNHGLIDMGEMALSLRQIRLLSFEFFLERTREASSSSSSLHSEFNSLKFLTASVQRIFDRGESFPHVWRQIPKLHRLVDSICESQPQASISSEQFSTELIMRLLYCSLPLTIPSAYILKLGRKMCDEMMCRIDPTMTAPPPLVKLSTILNVIQKDKYLCQSWWSSSSSYSSSSLGLSSSEQDLIPLVMESIALTCALPDASTSQTSSSSSSSIKPDSIEISLEKLLLTLCYGPSLSNDSIMTFQSSLCYSYHPTTSMAAVEYQPLPSPSQFLYESMTKLIAIGIRLLKYDVPTGAGHDDPAGSPSSTKYQTVFGPTIPCFSILQWIQKINHLDANLFSKFQASGKVILCKEILDELRAQGASNPSLPS